MYEFIKTIHLLTVILFVGTVFFRTFVLFKLNKYFESKQSLNIQKILGKEARRIIGINNIILILTGFYLFYTFYLQSASIVLKSKMILGLILVIIFYMLPKILEKIGANLRVSLSLHYIYFLLLILVIIFSQYI
ncbi:hypothetical protein [Aliarcobacter thereius]|uniref:DUF2269 family protein n=2 Tax=Aliarcobacter thereius TaxID=544718 RepID=A0A1C0B979_9BACT|nr:hypothetical protein [Aliarcobacter thereius]OCL92194.1 hypothetical protein AAX25_00924 [Aliarcobacter thereius]OCL94710.1 hypothetical protein AA347_00149 [Aliarcobacter thereius LMG 24486]OCM00156.1 hypothetical protein AAX29_00154 [Aliarcobacter thereius]QBF15414.1 putative membrane protein [Aliarcobacter thereius LMG 24486]TLS93230.1 hypothetical protein FE244_04535 [Aliarcobacter thereius]